MPREGGEAERRYWPLWHLTISRMRVFYREPAAVFWVYGFPLVMALSLGTAFREDPEESISVDLVAANADAAAGKDSSSHESAHATAPQALLDLRDRLAIDSRFKLRTLPEEDWRKRLQAGKTDLVIEVNGGDTAMPYQLWDEPHRTESRLARYAVEAALLRADSPSSVSSDRAGPPGAGQPEVKHLAQAGSRYIDFLLPGLIGLNLMGGGMWGVGFVIVDMRVRKLLKRFLATPMRRSDFLLAVMCSRLFFTLTDIAILLVFGYAVFHVHSRGDYLSLTVVVLLGGATFAGIGLLVASRAQTIETVSGVMNFVMLPMWILSGVFFSSERFPAEVQPLINLLPLTALNQALRAVMLEGQSLLELWPQLAVLTAYSVIGFAVALRVFRWR
jgi:ABC-type multidrug transport system permease subunit